MVCSISELLQLLVAGGESLLGVVLAKMSSWVNGSLLTCWLCLPTRTGIIRDRWGRSSCGRAVAIVVEQYSSLFLKCEHFISPVIIATNMVQRDKILPKLRPPCQSSYKRQELCDRRDPTLPLRDSDLRNVIRQIKLKHNLEIRRGTLAVFLLHWLVPVRECLENVVF